MKKFLFLAIAAAAMTSCSQDEVLEVAQKQAISFGNAFVGNSTRAAVDPSYTTDENATNGKQLETIKVYGAVEDVETDSYVNIFNGVTVKKNNKANGVAWDQTDGDTQYWVAGANYIFDAVVDANKVNTGADGLPTSLEYDATLETQTDMLHCRVTKTGQASNNPVVAFTFNHLLSKVKFTALNTTAAGIADYRFTVTDIVIGNAYKSGKYAVVEQTVDDKEIAAGEWFALVSNGTHSIADLEVASNSTVECAKEVLLIPGASVSITFNLNVQIKKGETWETINVIPVSKEDVVTLEANNAYNFKVEYGIGGQILFTANEMSGWETQDDISVYPAN